MIERTDYHDRTEQAITLNLPDLVTAALQQALNDGNGLDAIDRNTNITLTVNARGHSVSFDSRLDFDVVRDLETGALFAESDWDENAQVTLTITNPDRRLR